MRDFLHRLWQAWLNVGHVMGNIVAHVFLGVFYGTVFVPFGVGVRLWGDPLNLKPPKAGASDAPLWLERSTSDVSLDAARRLF